MQVGAEPRGGAVEVADDPLAGVSPFRDFATAASGVLRFLHERVGLDLWLVTQVVGDRQVAVAARPQTLIAPGHGHPLGRGLLQPHGRRAGPRVASVTAAVPAYAGLSFGPAKRVSSYLGVPLVRADGDALRHAVRVRGAGAAADAEPAPAARRTHGAPAQHRARPGGRCGLAGAADPPRVCRRASATS